MSKPNKYEPHQGKKECTRRLKQFDRWYAKAEDKWSTEKLLSLAELIRTS